MSFHVISEISLPTGDRFVVGSGAENTVSPGDICEVLGTGCVVRIQVLQVGVRTLERVQADLDGLLVHLFPPEAPSLIGQEMHFAKGDAEEAP